MLVLKKIIAIDETKAFVGEYNRLANMNVNIDYANGCEMFGWINEHKQLLGGYCFATGNAMAWPKLVSGNVSFFNTQAMDRCLEFNLAWAKGTLHNSAWRMFTFWIKSAQLINERYDVDVITFAVDAKRTGLVRMYEAICDCVIYKGRVEKYPGMDVIVYGVSKKRFANLAWLGTPMLVKRLFKSCIRTLKATVSYAI